MQGQERGVTSAQFALFCLVGILGFVALLLLFLAALLWAAHVDGERAAREDKREACERARLMGDGLESVYRLPAYHGDRRVR
jgi:hypothetical protein